MASVAFDGLSAYMEQLAKLGQDTDKICKAAVFDGAAVVHDGIESEIDTLPSKTGVTKAGLKKGLGFAKMKNEKGYINTKIGFSGYNTRGVPNALMARVIVRGTSKKPKNDFVGRAVRRSKAKAIEAIEKKLDEMIQSKMK